MRMIFDDMIVEIRAKSCEEDRFTKRETMAAMNWLSIILQEAAENYEHTGSEVFAKKCRDEAHGIYEKLKKMGYYK